MWMKARRMPAGSTIAGGCVCVRCGMKRDGERRREEADEYDRVSLVLLFLVAGRGKNRPIFCGGPIFGVASTAA